MHACCCEKGEKEAREHQILQNLHQKRNKNMKHIHGQKNIKKTYDEVRMKLGRGILTLQDNFILSDLTSKRPQSKFPEIRGFPVQNATFWGPKGRFVRSRANLTRTMVSWFVTSPTWVMFEGESLAKGLKMVEMCHLTTQKTS